MSNFTRHMKDDVTYWSASGYGQTGKQTFNAPVALKGRWENRMEQIRNKSGSEIVSKSRVFVTAEISADGYLFFGTSVAADPTVVNGAVEIQAIARQPDLRSLKQLNVAYL